MLDQDTIEQQQALLVENRRRLAVLLQQQARLGDYAPPHVRLEIEDTQAAIRTLKADLRAAAVVVEDEANDDMQPAAAPAPSHLTPQEQRNRSRMLDKVETFWIKGVLEHSLYQVARIELGFEQAPAQVSHPWETILHQVDQPNQTIPAGKSVVAVFDELLGEMLILGAPGAGKTTTLLELARDLIARARQNEHHSIPVVFNLSTWATKRLPLGKWLAEELNQRYDVPKKLAQEWVAANTLLPLFDGLDEVAAEHRVACVEAINDYRKVSGFIQLAVCSRVADYEALTSKLRLQGAMVIQPLTRPQVDDYLKQAGRRLVAVRAALRDDPSLWELMDTPLLLSTVALTYKDTSAAKLRASGTTDERRRELFDDYITAMFARPGRSTRTSYTQQKTIHSLAWLAGKIIEQKQTVLYIERLQPGWLPRRGRRWFPIRVGFLSALVGGLVGGLVVAMVFGLLGGLIVGLGVRLRAGLRAGMVAGLGFGLLAGLLGGLNSYSAEIRPVETLRWSWVAAGGGWRSSLVLGLVFGLGAGLVFGLGTRLLFGLVFGLAFGLEGWILGWLAGEVTDGQITRRTAVDNPKFRQLVWYILAFGLVFGVGFALLGGVGFALIGGLSFALLGGLLGGLVFGLATREIPTRTVDRKSIRRASWSALVSGLLAGLGCGLLAGLRFGLLAGLSGGLVGGLGGTTFGWLGSWLGDRDGTQRATLHNTALRRFARNALSGGLGVGLGAGLGFGLLGGPVEALVSGLSGWLVFALIGGLLSGLIEGDITTRTVTNEGIRRSIRSAIVGALVGALVGGLGVGLVFILIGSLSGSPVFAMLGGLGVGLVFGLLYGGATVLQHYTLRWLLYRNGSLPLRLVPFLDYCAERIFLRKVGGSYIFVHRLLMEHFASLNTSNPPAEPAEAQQSTP